MKPMRSFQLITSDPRKVKAYQCYAKSAGLSIEIQLKHIDLPAYQNSGQDELLQQKILYVKERTSLPFIIEDRAAIGISYLNQETMFYDQIEGLVSALDELFAFLQNIQQEERCADEQMRKRWDTRAKDWSTHLQDPSSYVNYQEGYQRFLNALHELPIDHSGRALDIGCGTGEVALQLAATTNLDVTGIDASSSMIEIAQQSQAQRLQFIHSSFNDFESNEPFNLLVSRGVVLSHIPATSLIDVLQKITRLTTPGGYCVLDYIQNAEQGTFPSAHALHVIRPEDLRRWMQELGWIQIASDAQDRHRVGISTFYKDDQRTVYFVSGNRQKFAELLTAVGPSNTHFVHAKLDIDELKSDDLEYIVQDKLQRAYSTLQRPVICTDGGIFIEALKKFPGPNSKQAAQTLGANGIVTLMQSISHRTAIRKTCLGYFDGTTMRFHTAEIACEISQTARGDQSSYPFDTILVPCSDRNRDKQTYAEMSPKERVPFTELPQLALFLKGILS